MKQALSQDAERQQNHRKPSQLQHAPTPRASLTDHRESTTQLRQMQVAMEHSPQAIAQRQHSEQFHNSPRMVTQRQQMASIAGKPLQKMVEDEEELIQGMFESKAVQRVEDEDELIRGKFEPVQRAPALALAQKPNNTGLPDNLKNGIESLSGLTMDYVKVHYNSDKPVQLNAHAYAQGSDIHLAPGQEKHLPHEAWHVVQQAQGRVRPTMQMAGQQVNDDQGLEREADAMGERAVAGGVAQRKSIESDPIGSASPVVQMIFIGDSAKHHLHVEINQDHYKYGNDKGGRIELGQNGNYKLDNLIEARNYLVNNDYTSDGGTECINWLEEECRNHEGWSEEAGFTPSYELQESENNPHAENILEQGNNFGLNRQTFEILFKRAKASAFSIVSKRYDENKNLNYYPEDITKENINSSLEELDLMGFLAISHFPSDLYSRESIEEYLQTQMEQYAQWEIEDEFPLPTDDSKNYHTTPEAIVAHQSK